MAAGLTFAALVLEPHATLEALELAAPGGRVDVPSLVVLRVTPVASETLPALEVALGGSGRPRGVRGVLRDGPAVVVELDARVTSLSLVVALIDVELVRFPGRRIEPLLPLDDATLTAFARQLLAEPDLDAERLIETHLEPLLAAGAGGAV